MQPVQNLKGGGSSSERKMVIARRGPGAKAGVSGHDVDGGSQVVRLLATVKQHYMQGKASCPATNKSSEASMCA